MVAKVADIALKISVHLKFIQSLITKYACSGSCKPWKSHLSGLPFIFNSNIRYSQSDEDLNRASVWAFLLKKCIDFWDFSEIYINF